MTMNPYFFFICYKIGKKNNNTRTRMTILYIKQGRKRPLDTPERKIERRERGKERESDDGNTELL